MKTDIDTHPKPSITKHDLFMAFLLVGLTSFGGVLPWAHRMLVEKRGWLTHEEFTEALSLGQILPGPNIVNVSIMVGGRFHGKTGALCAFTGLLLVPFIIVLILAMLYTEYKHIESVQSLFRATAASTAGLVVAMGCRMAMKQPRSWRTGVITALALIGSGFAGLPLLTVLAILAPVSLGLAWSESR